jgi:hypothetical protein
VHERLREPAEVITNALNLFQYQKEIFNESIPTISSLGILKIDSRNTRQMLLPAPIDALQQTEKVCV